MGRFSCGGIDSALAQHNDHWKQFWKLRNFKLFGLAHKQYFQTIHREEVRARVSTDWCASSTMTIREEPMTCFTPPKKMQQMIRCGLFVLFLLPSVFLLHAFRRRKAVAKYKLPPGPTPLPLIGSLHQLGDLPHLSLHRLSQKYGPLMLIYLGQVPTVIISRAKAASEVLRNQEHLFCNRKPLTATERFSYGGIDIAFAPRRPLEASPEAEQLRGVRPAACSHFNIRSEEEGSRKYNSAWFLHGDRRGGGDRKPQRDAAMFLQQSHLSEGVRKHVSRRQCDFTPHQGLLRDVVELMADLAAKDLFLL
ncbi:hypothetical protein HPP92_028172 [Vanilla planifolia]|uniref:Cytochrome P450 n=1 Tax=Vanilla planifolia TaxID=51239 RepID=A0A835PBY4_VANPL|nr:hypothetical protein HPP92_028172 [Vanilla planifolia]